MGERFILHDVDIREPLFEYFEEKHDKVRIIEELSMGKSRADAVMITPDSLTGIEIKSDADTYARLGRQIKDYDRFYDYNYVVVGSSHATHIAEHVPEHWGIISVEVIDEAFDFYEVRVPSKNPAVLIENKIRLMWRPELVVIQELNEMPKYKSMSKEFVINKILERIPDRIQEEAINAQICDLLLNRDYAAIFDAINEYRIANNMHKRRRTKKRQGRKNCKT